MSANIKFVTTRTNTNTDFWWTTTDPAVVALRNAASEIADQMNIPRETFISPDQLTYTVSYLVNDETHWQQLAAAVTASIPAMTSTRNSYHTAAGHSLKLEVRLAEPDDQLLQDFTIVQ